MSILGQDLAVALVDDAFIFSTQAQANPLVLPAYAAIQKGTTHATGSAARIPGLAQMIADQLGHAVTQSPAGCHPSIEGCKMVLKELKFVTKVRPTGK